MRKTALSSAIAALLVCACSLAPKAIAADATASTQAIQPAKLPYGVEDVLKLARANVPEATIVSFIQNSGMVYDLGAQDIVYLRNEGVPDRVINAMLRYYG